jgi:2'-5' RNA ligase
MARLYFAFWPGPALRAELARLTAGIAFGRARRVPADRLHLTLAFLGELDAARQDLALQVGANVQSSAFELELDRLGWWPAPRVAWLAPSRLPPALVELEWDLRQALLEADLPIDGRPYRPHLTIAREVTAAPTATGPVAVRWAVDSFTLIESRIEAGSRQYVPLHDYPLVPPDER